MEIILSSFILIFFAEMGDKSQFLALIFATKYRLHQVLIGIFLGILLNHGIAVALAYFLSSFINIEILKLIAGIMFLIFAFESFILREEDEENQDIRRNLGAILTVAVCFFIGELGDKTQITTMSIVFSGGNPLYTLMGTVSAMLCVSFFGIFVGKFLKGRLDKNIMKKISGVIFLFFGIQTIYKAVPKQYITIASVLAFFMCIIGIMIYIFTINRKIFNK